MADVAFKMFSLLMLNEDLFIVEVSITIPTPWLHLLLLLPPHLSINTENSYNRFKYESYYLFDNSLNALFDKL